MPCDSRIFTKMTEGGRIADALRRLGYEVDEADNHISGRQDRRVIEFSKRGDTWTAQGALSGLSAIARKYAEIGVRSWAQRRGYSVTESDGRQMALINRRG